MTHPTDAAAPPAEARRPAITVGILTHNYGRYLRQSIESVLTQDRADVELIVCDDVSTDDTADVVRPYLSDPHVRYVRHETNLRQAGNWGFLLDQGSAPRIMAVDADDYLLPGALATVLGAFESDPELDIVFGNWMLKHEGRDARALELGKYEADRTFTGFEAFRYQASRHTWRPSVTALSRRIVRETGKPDRSLQMIVDTEFFLRCSLRARRVRAVSAPLTVYRVHGVSATARTSANGVFAEERRRVTSLCEREVRAITPAGARPNPIVIEGLRDLRRASAHSLFSDGVTAGANGDWTRAREMMRSGLALDRSLMLRPKVLLDLALSHGGAIGRRLFHLLHMRRAVPAAGAAAKPIRESAISAVPR